MACNSKLKVHNLWKNTVLGLKCAGARAYGRPSVPGMWGVPLDTTGLIRSASELSTVAQDRTYIFSMRLGGVCYHTLSLRPTGKGFVSYIRLECSLGLSDWIASDAGRNMQAAAKFQVETEAKDPSRKGSPPNPDPKFDRGNSPGHEAADLDDRILAAF